MALMSCRSTSSKEWQSQLKRTVLQEKAFPAACEGVVALRVAVADMFGLEVGLESPGG
jgi:hypothetical protein